MKKIIFIIIREININGIILLYEKFNKHLKLIIFI